MCFDKTGTLTEEGLDMYGVRVVKEQKFSKVYQDSSEIDVSFIKAMACCHGLAWVKGKLVGDPLELKMFETTKWELIENANHVEVRNDANVLKVLRRFEFSSKLQRMSVIVEDNGNYIVYMKGSPEKLR